jgi:hypothetical protein
VKKAKVISFTAALLILFFSTFLSFGQNISRNIRIVSGGNLIFSINQLKDYSGITYTEWTRLTYYYNDTTNFGLPGTSTGWIITVRAQDPGFISENGFPDLPPQTLVLRTENSIGPTTTTISLTNADQTIASGSSITGVSGQLKISYDFGKDPLFPLLYKQPDFYSVNLIMTISSVY